jgi:formylglycine-generating enzyme required for sulfatase activity
MSLVFVPEGESLMGASEGDLYATSDEHPEHVVFLDAFWIDSTEVTNAMYAHCVAEGACSRVAEDASLSREDYFSDASCRGYPVVEVSWLQAEAYCRWADRRLPTEAEWEKAARGTDGRVYPWGDAAPTGATANLCGNNCPNEANTPEIDDGFYDTSPVGSYPAGVSPYGALDMAGNVWEWVADWGDTHYYSTAPRENPMGPETGEFRVARGGSFMSPAEGVRTTIRAYFPADLSGGPYTGFRCALGEGE